MSKGSELHFVLGRCPAGPGPVWGLTGTGQVAVITEIQVKNLVHADLSRGSETDRPEAARQAGLSAPSLSRTDCSPHTPLLQQDPCHLWTRCSKDEGLNLCSFSQDSENPHLGGG